MRVMISGAGGYLGTKLARCLESEGHKVTGVYRKIPAETGTLERKMLLAETEEIRKELQNVQYDWVINCAAVYEHSHTQIHQIVDANTIFALQMLDCLLECGVKKMLNIDTGLPKYTNLYSFTKKQFAEFGEFYAGRYGITFVNVLLEMFYGEDEPEGRFLSECCRKMIRGESLFLTKGTQKRDIIYIDDVCNAIKRILEGTLDGYCSISVGNGEAVSIRTVIEYMHKVIKSDSALNFGAVPARADEPDCVADMEILAGMGFKPKYSWKQGIRRLCRKTEMKSNK